MRTSLSVVMAISGLVIKEGVSTALTPYTIGGIVSAVKPRGARRMAVIANERHKRDLVLRLKRVEGQLRGIQAMIEQDCDCERVTQQLSAARRALDKAFFQVLACAIQAAPPAPAERLSHAAELLARFG